ncbi:metallophosphoesterase family protein [Sphingomonas sp. KC8]|uniref:metallophosphoesterase family protein n=1 Tax=Sphingomonas sp. KC8 TaxID=1030157 RepID=UPI000248A3A7|nr:metallophosphoesterase [Sphingomonas sp. KC8]ARS28860.1 metallophosphoesterase [Sphingomonas sp. KC8]
MRILAISMLATAGMAHAAPATPAAAPAPWTKAPANDPQALRFAVIGDRTGLARPGVFEQAIKQVDLMQPEFLINVGDLIEGYTGDAAELAREWGEMETAIGQLRAPFIYVAGNHDIGNDMMLSAWKAKRGEPYYQFTYKDVLFLVLDTEDPPPDMPADFAKQFHQMAAGMKNDPVATEKALAQFVGGVNADREKGKAVDPEMLALSAARFSPKQVDFALKALADQPKPRWTFVLMHKPAWKLNSAEFAKIEAALAGRPYTVIAGHNHYYAHEKRHGRDYITMGTAGAISHQHGPGEMDHIAWVTVKDGEPDIALIKLNGLLDRTGQSGQTMVR